MSITAPVDIRARIRGAFVTRTWPYTVLIVTVGTLVRIPQLFNSLMDSNYFRQTQTATVIREYSRTGIDLLHTPLPVFGPDADVPMEFPLFQALASLLTKAGMSVDVSARTMGLISFQATAVILVVLVARWHGRVAAISAVVLLEFLPFGLQWGASSMIDFFAVALALAMVLCLDLWFVRGRILWLALGSVTAVLAFLVKSTTAPIWCIVLIGSTIAVVKTQGWEKARRRQITGWLCGPILGFIASLGWTAYADHVKSSQELTRFLTSDSLMYWNLGTISQRLTPGEVQLISQRVAEEIVGAGLLAILVVFVVAFRARPLPDRVRFVGWIAAALSGPLVFFNLYFVHDYYLIAIYPAIVATMGISISWLIATTGAVGGRRALAVAASLIAILWSTALSGLGQIATDGFRFSGSIPTPVEALGLADLTEPDDLIVMIGCKWNPGYFYLADRKGVMFRGDDSGTFWETEDVSRYTLLVSCNAELDPSDYLPDNVIMVTDPVYDRYYHLVASG